MAAAGVLSSQWRWLVPSSPTDVAPLRAAATAGEAWRPLEGQPRQAEAVLQEALHGVVVVTPDTSQTVVLVRVRLQRTERAGRAVKWCSRLGFGLLGRWLNTECVQ